MLRNGCGTLHILWHILWLGFLMPVGNVGLAGQPRPQNQRGLAPGTLAACCASSKTPAMVDETAQPPGRHDSKSMGTRAPCTKVDTTPTTCHGSEAHTLQASNQELLRTSTLAPLPQALSVHAGAKSVLSSAIVLSRPCQRAKLAADSQQRCGRLSQI